jgi:hypothetical protein
LLSSHTAFRYISFAFLLALKIPSKYVAYAAKLTSMKSKIDINEIQN